MKKILSPSEGCVRFSPAKAKRLDQCAARDAGQLRLSNRTTMNIPHQLPVIGNLLTTLQRHGFTVVSVNQEFAPKGTNRQIRQWAKHEIAGVEVSDVSVVHPELHLPRWFQVVLGNEPGEIVGDCTHNTLLEKAIEEFEANWKGEAWPTKLVIEDIGGEPDQEELEDLRAKERHNRFYRGPQCNEFEG